MWNVYDIEQSTMEPISKMKNKCFWTYLFQYKANSRDESQERRDKSVGLLMWILHQKDIIFSADTCIISNFKHQEWSSYKQVTEAEAR